MPYYDYVIAKLLNVTTNY